jgi:hypothetical protein
MSFFIEFTLKFWIKKHRSAPPGGVDYLLSAVRSVDAVGVRGRGRAWLAGTAGTFLPN